MLDERLCLLVKEQWLDMQRQARARYLITQALASQPHSPGFHFRILVWLGQRFIAVGRRLVSSYSPTEAYPEIGREARAF